MGGPLDFRMRTRIVSGTDSMHGLGRLASELGGTRALLVTDRGIVEAGHAERAAGSLRRAGLAVAEFAETRENPTTRDVDAGRESADRFGPDLIVGLGGGSAMDCAKGINFVHSNGGRMSDYWGVGKAARPMLPMIGIPTTAGTGSEVQSFALISDAETHVKMACGDEKAAFRVALLDPSLTLTQPPRVTALTGLDAIAHAVESYVSTRRNAISTAFSVAAWRLLAGNLDGVLRNPTDIEARSNMQLGACLAGLAIENAMLGAAHALANPLTTHFGLPHGSAVAILLPHVVRHNGATRGAWYGELLAAGAAIPGMPDSKSAAGGLAAFLESLTRRAGLETRLASMIADRDAIPRLARDAANQWTGKFNPRGMTEDDYRRLYENAW
ncbi:MAG: iron-containing alcohol dehydrogenase [Planctomycetes bacterium]|nr:iron-containing alcohol dehydrogenase [Planctomycetota bacterium]